MDAAKFGIFKVKLHKTSDDWNVAFEDYDLCIPLRGFGTPFRARRDGWQVKPIDGQKARLVEVLFLLGAEFIHVSIIDCENGPIWIWTTDENKIRQRHFGYYLENSYRVDALLTSMKGEANSFKLNSKGSSNRGAELLNQVKYLYRAGEDKLLQSISVSKAPRPYGNLLRVKDLFEDDTHFASFAALSLIQPLYAGFDQSREALLDRIDKYLPRFDGNKVDRACVRQLVMKPSPFCSVPSYLNTKIWCSFGTFS